MPTRQFAEALNAKTWHYADGDPDQYGLRWTDISQLSDRFGHVHDRKHAIGQRDSIWEQP